MRLPALALAALLAPLSLLARDIPPVTSNQGLQGSVRAIGLHELGLFQDVLDNFSPYDLSDQPMRLNAYCSALLHTGRYRQFFECIDIWDSAGFVITPGVYLGPKGHYPGTLHHPPTEHSLAMTPDQFEARKSRLLAQAWFEMGDYELALQHANRALTLYDLDHPRWQPGAERHWTYTSGSASVTDDPDAALPTGNGRSSWIGDILYTLSIAAQAEVHLGVTDHLDQRLIQMDQIHRDSDGDEPLSHFWRTRQISKNQVLFAAGRFDQVVPTSKSGAETFEDFLGGTKIATGALLMAASLLSGSNPHVATALMESGAEDINSELGARMVQREKLQAARIAAHQNQPEQALQVLNALLAEDADSLGEELLWYLQQQRGEALMALGRQQEALDAFESAITIVEQSRGNVSTEAQKLGFANRRTAPYKGAAEALIALEQPESALLMSERLRARALVDLLADSRLRSPVTVDVAALTQLAPLPAEDQKHAAVSADNERGLKRKSAPKVVASLTPEQSRQVSSLNQGEVSSLAQIQAGLRPAEALLEFMEVEGRWYAWKVDRHGVEVQPLNAADLDRRVIDYMSQIRQPGGPRPEKEARLLYRDLLGTFDLTPYQHLTLVPAGVLNQLAFASLMPDQRFLIETHSVRILPSASVARFLTRESRHQTLLALGNPTLDLPGAEQEVRQLTRLGYQSHARLRHDASESLIKEIGAGFDVIHIASHGIFDTAQPAASRLLLAPDARNDGTLTLGEIYSLSLSANLVVMSACETGLGQITEGEEIIGLTRGFLFAGSNNVMASLWKVNDNATQALMNDFYRGASGQPYSVALQQAQIARLRQQPHPYYWAAFQLTGVN
ncbi:CHAT domain-containing protein [Marinobacter hydrocarbonoclasticus]|nr:CHAT domain-containing protein [Marinobacter nauticus]